MANLGKLRHTMPLMLQADTIDYLNWIKAGLSKQRNAEVSVSETVEYLVQRHWIKMQKLHGEQRHERKVERRPLLRA